MTVADARVSVIIPAYNEGELVVPVLDRLFESVKLPCEVLIVVDSENDTTVPVVSEYAQKESRLRYLVNTYGPGPGQRHALWHRRGRGAGGRRDHGRWL